MSIELVTMGEHEEAEIIAHALRILEIRMRKRNLSFEFENVLHVKHFLILKFSKLEHEVFSGIFLDSKGGVICYKELFRGTLNHTGIIIREVVKEALKVNAAHVIFAHNHPSGDETPSASDDEVTELLIKGLALVDVKVVDHIIVGGVKTYSYCEKGKLM